MAPFRPAGRPAQRGAASRAPLRPRARRAELHRAPARGLPVPHHPAVPFRRGAGRRAHALPPVGLRRHLPGRGPAYDLQRGRRQRRPRDHAGGDHRAPHARRAGAADGGAGRGGRRAARIPAGSADHVSGRPAHLGAGDRDLWRKLPSSRPKASPTTTPAARIAASRASRPSCASATREATCSRWSATPSPATAWPRARATSRAGPRRAASWWPTAAPPARASWPLSAQALRRRTTFYGGASALPNEAGVGVRLLARDGARLRSGLEAAWRAVRLALYGAPPARSKKVILEIPERVRL